eukprot:Opistho-2@8890
MRSFQAAIVVVAALLVAAAAAAPAQKDAPTTCHALALAGGGDRGAFEAGAMLGLIENLPADQVAWNVITGISAGAINTGALCQYKVGDEIAGVNWLVDQWLSIRKSDIYKDWPLGLVQGFFAESGLFDTSPLIDFLKSHVDFGNLTSSGRDCVVGATSLTEANYQQFNKTDPNFLTALRASSAVPGVFPAVSLNGQEYVDGGAEYMTPVADAIQRCKKVADDVTVDVILCVGFELPASNYKWNTPALLLRTIAMKLTDILMKDIQNARVAYPDAKIRVIYPTVWLPGFFLDFDPKNSQFMIEQGYKDAVSVLKSEAASRA